MPETILVEREGRVAILTINRPDKLNALNQQVRDEMLEILAGIEHDDQADGARPLAVGVVPLVLLVVVVLVGLCLVVLGTRRRSDEPELD